MSTIRNAVQLIGNLGKDPEVKSLDNGKTVANVSLATSDYYLSASGEKVEQTQWHHLVAWGKTAQYMEKYLQKGANVAVKGKLTHRTFEDKEGNQRMVTEVLVNEILSLSRKN
jgi:single-strand DNA-binding protein